LRRFPASISYEPAWRRNYVSTGAEVVSVGFRVASPAAQCNDGDDNDDDALIDYPNDPGCFAPTSDNEEPKCQDGEDNDGDGKIDSDVGLSALGYLAATPDPQCTYGWQGREAKLS